MKITYSQNSLQSSGAINFVDKIIKDTAPYSHVNQTLGDRRVAAK